MPKPPRVSISHTDERHRSPERVRELVRQALEPLGGMNHFVQPGQTVLLKPNQTVFYGAEEGCTTDPLVVGALIELAKEAGAKRVQVGESSGGFFESIQCMRITGIAAVAEKHGAELVDLGSDSVPNRVVQIPNGKVIKEVPLPIPLLDADVIIDVPKAKNHHTDPISGALKNWMGCVNRVWRQHNHGDMEAYGRFMDIMSVIRPHLVVTDAIIVGEGDGPIANLPIWCGCIVATSDPVANDAAVCQLLGHDWKKMHHIRQAVERGIGMAEPLELVGAPLDNVAIKVWPGHPAFDHLPINVLLGKGVSLPGTAGHVKSVFDSMLRRQELREVIFVRGTPTIMLGEIEDPNFEQHLKEGPYLVFDDAALPKYKNDPRVYFVPGHPVLRSAMPQIFEGLGLKWSGNVIMKWQQYQRKLEHNIEYGSTKRRAITVGKPLLAAAALVAGIAILGRTILD
ncbi:MAG TPA: DUF362 domain-containing protein [Tepidisphaeraceae bacterium]|nr:DUF362 domain-containing protein [Tepidisphaeraceae bacterium]